MSIWMSQWPHRLAIASLALWVTIGCGQDNGTALIPLSQGAQFLTGATHLSVPIIGTQRLPLVQGTINGVNLIFLLDTGTVSSIVSSTLLGVDDDSATRADELCLDQMCFLNVALYAIDTPFSRSEQGEINGIIGMHLLQHFVVELSYLETVQLKFEQGACEVVYMPLKYDLNGRPMADIIIDGTRFDDMLLDTGGTYTAVGHRGMSMLQAYVFDSAQEVGLCTIDGCSDAGAFLSSVNEVCLFDACATNVQIKYPVWNALGNTYFSNHRQKRGMSQTLLEMTKDIGLAQIQSQQLWPEAFGGALPGTYATLRGLEAAEVAGGNGCNAVATKRLESNVKSDPKAMWRLNS